jgi:hypothetical protein
MPIVERQCAEYVTAFVLAILQNSICETTEETINLHFEAMKAENKIRWSIRFWRIIK